MLMRGSARQQPNKSFKLSSFHLFVETSKKRATLRRRPRRPRRRVEWRWSSSTSAFTSCQCDATIPNTCSISHMLSTSDFYLSNKSFQLSPLSQSQRSLQYSCTQNQFTVHMYTKQVYSTGYIKPVYSTCIHKTREEYTFYIFCHKVVPHWKVSSSKIFF